ncbi:hypothetical protein FGO68_gene2247 [Halteria grandinella]|uniref:Uncharacterized protein n=1 Tax=Halteria grandinella TaxID=5974 RepID=A0A8J8NK11_HALGN|nr:hypothetical protein FGO68_gene2247 [Halteria grandinella]
MHLKCTLQAIPPHTLVLLDEEANVTVQCQQQSKIIENEYALFCAKIHNQVIFIKSFSLFNSVIEECLVDSESLQSAFCGTPKQVHTQYSIQIFLMDRLWAQSHNLPQARHREYLGPTRMRHSTLLTSTNLQAPSQYASIRSQQRGAQYQLYG